MVLGEFVFLKAKLKVPQLLSVILCIVGIAMFYNPNDELNPMGSLYALLSGVTYATYVLSLYSLKKKNIPIFRLSLYVASICSVVMLGVCALTKQLTIPHTVTGWLLTIFFAFALNVGAVVLFQRGTFIVGGSRAAILSTFEPITSVVAGVVIFSETISAFTIAGTVFVIGASIIIAVCDMRSVKE